MQTEYKFDVFISYSSRDKAWVRGELLTRIEQARLKVCIDFRDFEPGKPALFNMQSAVRHSRRMLLVMTSDWFNWSDSQWTLFESMLGATKDPAGLQPRLISLLLKKSKMPENADFIAALTYIDFTDGADLDLAWCQILTALEAPLPLCAEESIPVEIQTELDRAKVLTDADKYSEAIPILEEALTAADGSGHTVARVKVRVDLARALYEAREDFSGAEHYYREALALIAIGDLNLRFKALNGLGCMLLCAGRLDEAKASLQSALDAAKLSGKTDLLTQSLISLSLLERALGFHDSAMAKLDEAVDLLLKEALSPLPDDEKKKNASTLAVCYLNKALLCRDDGNIEEALALYGKAEEQHRISGDKLDAGKALLFRCELHCDNADWEKGWNCFQQMLEIFREVGNPLWGARSLELISRFYAVHESWEEALHAALGAVAGAEESGHVGDQVHFLCTAVEVIRNWKTTVARRTLARMLYKSGKGIPKEKQAQAVSDFKIKEKSDSIEKAVREDEEVRDLLNKAKEIAKRERLHSQLANCLLYEAHKMMPPDDSEARHNLIAQAVDLLKEKSREAKSPKQRGHLMAWISELYRELGDLPEALSWLKKAGDVFEKCGDAFGLAMFHGSLAELHRAEGRSPDDVIASYRKVLSIIEGRSFHHLAAQARIGLSVALRFHREFDEAQKLLNEAETLCDRHHFNDLITRIARNRDKIEEELQAAQAPTRTLPQLLSSLHQLIRYRPEHAVAYLPFWYSAWKTELLALVRSGPQISLMVPTDDADDFLRFAAKFGHLAGHFLMTTCHEPVVKVEAGVLPIPPKWLFPATFTFMGVEKASLESWRTKQDVNQDGEDALPNYRLMGPARMFPLYKYVGDGCVMTQHEQYLPQGAIDLMVRQSLKKLIQRRAVWFPTPRFQSEDPFLTDLRMGYECGVFPTYFNCLPTSEAVVACGGVQISIPDAVLKGDHPSMAAKWGRALLRITKLQKDEAQAALLDLPDVFADADNHKVKPIQIEIRLFEFDEMGQRLFHPALLIRE